MSIIKNRIPDKGTVENMMQRLQSYIEPVDPEWAEKLKPASEESIKKWKKVLALEEKNWIFLLRIWNFYDMQEKGMEGFLRKR